jgi:hypothetical protein
LRLAGEGKICTDHQVIHQDKQGNNTPDRLPTWGERLKGAAPFINNKDTAYTILIQGIKGL